MIMEDVFRDYGQFENIENKKIIIIQETIKIPNIILRVYFFIQSPFAIIIYVNYTLFCLILCVFLLKK